MAKISSARKRALEALLGQGPLLAVETAGIAHPAHSPGEEPSYSLRMKLEGDRVAVLALDDPYERVHLIGGWTWRLRDGCPMYIPQVTCDALRATGIRAEAVALVKGAPRRLEALWVLAKGGQREVLPISGPAGLGFAFGANVPVVCTERIARTLSPAACSPSTFRATP